jgi:hypothetical protein
VRGHLLHYYVMRVRKWDSDHAKESQHAHFRGCLIVVGINNVIHIINIIITGTASTIISIIISHDNATSKPIFEIDAFACIHNCQRLVVCGLQVVESGLMLVVWTHSAFLRQHKASSLLQVCSLHAMLMCRTS